MRLGINARLEAERILEHLGEVGGQTIPQIACTVMSLGWYTPRPDVMNVQRSAESWVRTRVGYLQRAGMVSEVYRKTINGGSIFKKAAQKTSTISK